MSAGTTATAGAPVDPGAPGAPPRERREPREARRPDGRGERRLTIALWIGLCAAVAPLLSVVAAGLWVLGVLLLTAAILATGSVLRRLRTPAFVVTLAEFAIWVGAVTAVFFGGQAFLLVIPTPEVFSAVPALVQRASAEITLGVAPIEPTTAVSFIIVAAVGALTIALDHVVVTARMPLLASAALVAVWLIPAIAVQNGVDVVSFVVLGGAVLLLIRAETRTRESPEPGSSSGVTTVAVTIGSAAVILALMAGPALPTPDLTTTGSGDLASIDPNLNLGDDLRQRGDIPVLEVRSDAPTPPYLRVATLSMFDGNVWRPDRLRSVSLTEEGLEPLVVDEGIRVVQYRTNVEIVNLASAYIPVPFPAVSVDGLEGVWRTVPYSRTVLSGQTGAQGQSYEVISQLPRPTAEQIRAAGTSVDESAADVDLLSLPDDTPQIVFDLADSVTAEATNDYDRLIALQSWFRGTEFTYSLDAPVIDGFDGTGSDAVAAFLQVKEGYCIHFAGAFALMARALDMPSRIVVGFLPGTGTGEIVDGERVAEVTTSQLHAWPEVHFDGIGWVPFEPTKSLGTETRFLPEAQAGVDEGGEEISGPTPTATSTPSASAAPSDRPDGGPTGDDAAASPGVDVRPILLSVLAVLLVVAAPLLLRTGRRLVLHARARRTGAGRAAIGAAWRMVQDAAIDVGASVPAAESPRAFGARLVATHDAPEDEVSRLVAAIEYASYARDGAPSASGSAASAASAPSWAEDAERIRRAMLAALTPADRFRALLLPRSLVVRPGSAMAGSTVVATAP